MKPARDLTSLEVLEIAIRSEMDAAALYRKMGKLIKNKDLKARLARLESEEKKHRALFEGIYAKMFPETELKVPKKSFIPIVTTALSDDLPVKQLFQAAMEAEKVSERFYKDLAKRSTDLHGSSMMMYLANVERGHYDLLKNELEFIEAFPEYYDSEYFNFGDDMIHLGP